MQVSTSSYKAVQVSTSSYKAVQVSTSLSKAVQVSTSSYKAVQINTELYKAVYHIQPTKRPHHFHRKNHALHFTPPPSRQHIFQWRKTCSTDYETTKVLLIWVMFYWLWNRKGVTYLGDVLLIMKQQRCYLFG